MKHLSEEQIVLHFYGDADDAAGIETHLRECAECRRALETLKSVLAAVDASPAMQAPERGADYSEWVWQKLSPQLAEEKRVAWWRMDWAARMRPQRWALAGAMAALLIVAFVAGRITTRPTETAMQPVSNVEQVRERILLVAVGEHLERSQMVLVELQNAPTNGTVDITSEKQRARDLVGSNRLYRQTALNAGETGLAHVLEQLERVLVEVANSPSKISSNEMEGIRKRLESQGIIFKLRVVGSQVQERAMPTAVEPAPNRKTT